MSKNKPAQSKLLDVKPDPLDLATQNRTPEGKAKAKPDGANMQTKANAIAKLHGSTVLRCRVERGELIVLLEDGRKFYNQVGDS